MPVVAGVATLLIAALGTLSAMEVPAPAAPVGPSAAFAPASALSGSSASSRTDLLARRGQEVSRDSSRAARVEPIERVDREMVQAAEAQAKRRNAALTALGRKAEAQAAKIAENTWVLPLQEYRVSAHFGESSYLWSTVHTGQDLSAPSGTAIRSVANGVVTETGYDGSYGNKTVVTHADGTEIWYCHQTSFAVGVGDAVRGGQTIGTVGSTGNSTGPHLHIEVRPGGGDPVDPYQAFLEHGLTL